MRERYSEEYSTEGILAMNVANRLVILAVSRPETPAEKEQVDQERYALGKVVEILSKDRVRLALRKKKQLFGDSLKHARRVGADGIEATAEEDLREIAVAEYILASF